jgi:hypothetical protein
MVFEGQILLMSIFSLKGLACVVYSIKKVNGWDVRLGSISSRSPCCENPREPKALAVPLAGTDCSVS